MSSFNAVGVSLTAASPALIVKNAAWWPDIDAHDLRDVHRITDTVTDRRLQTAVTSAIAITNRQLREWQQQQATGGYKSLGAVPVPDYLPADGYTTLYLHAVYCEAHALLIERYRDYAASAVGMRDSDVKERTAHDYRRDAGYAISELCNRSRCVVELI